MDRKKFLQYKLMATAGLMFSPLSGLAMTDNKISTLSDDVFKNIIANGKYLQIEKLPKLYHKAYYSLIEELNKHAYKYNVDQLIKLSENCYALPLKKSSLFRSESELALISTQNGKAKYVILDNSLTEEFNNFQEGLKLGFKTSNLDENDITTPVSFLKNKNLNGISFTFKNKFNNTITLGKYKQKTYTLIN